MFNFGFTEPRASDHEAIETHECMRTQKLFLFERGQSEFLHYVLFIQELITMPTAG